MPLDPDKSSLRVAADIGGTFTDIAHVDASGQITTRKVLSTPSDYADGVLRGIDELDRSTGRSLDAYSDLLHACTVATNSILEHRGAVTALVTTRGFRDVLEMRRVRVPRLYEPLYEKPPPLVPRHLRLEVTERLDATGAVVTPLDETSVAAVAAELKREGVEAVAVCFLHAYANAAHERRAGELLRAALPGVFVTISSEVLPQLREYERTSTTVINAYVGPPVRRYLGSLQQRLRGAGARARLMVMQSGGGVADAAVAIERPAQIVECGPAAGVIGAAKLGEMAGYRRLLTLDMGGTTAKASMVEDGRLPLAEDYEVGGGISLSGPLVMGGGYALKLPVLDIAEVGAGGGSIVRIDAGGAMKVGPTSAGAVPGPVCYSRGGTQPTVTDANVVLGYLNPQALAGGSVLIDAEAARRAIRVQVAKPLGIDLVTAAFGVHRLANVAMVRAVKTVSTYRGRDPRDFMLFAFGGSGGVHGVNLARELAMTQVLVPPAAGVFSAVGLLLADVELSQSRACLATTDTLDMTALRALASEIGGDLLRQLGHPRDAVRFRHALDMRFRGQAYELPIDFTLDELGAGFGEALARRFIAEHERTYGFAGTGHLAV
ncbi:MAG: hydantoinase/oxoprolinase family protein, partial [Alphaproteobacteria bacterium]|nr:hydantoinase/oxoprolinase family protein [Alphaproteobacteria bacterium]